MRGGVDFHKLRAPTRLTPSLIYADGYDLKTTADLALALVFVPLFHFWVQYCEKINGRWNAKQLKASALCSVCLALFSLFGAACFLSSSR